MKRRAWRIVFFVAVTATYGAAIYFGTQSLEGELSDGVESDLFAFNATVGSIQIDTPPPLQREPGWPFDDLPLVAKFADPVPEIALVNTLPPGLFRLAVARKLPTADRPLAEDTSPLWMLSPLAAGALVGGSDDMVQSVIPEPSTLLLLSTGLLGLGWKAIRRRGEDPGGFTG